MEVAGFVIGEFSYLRDIEIPLDRVSVLFGPNGAGKSTILTALSGWDEAFSDLDTGVVFRLQPQADADDLLDLTSEGAASLKRELDRELQRQSGDSSDRHLDETFHLRSELEDLLPEDRTWTGLVGALIEGLVTEKGDTRSTRELIDLWLADPLIAVGLEREMRLPPWGPHLPPEAEGLHLSVDVVIDSRRLADRQTRDASQEGDGAPSHDLPLSPRVFHPFYRVGFIPDEDVWPPVQVFTLSRDPADLSGYVETHVGPIFERLFGSSAAPGRPHPMRFARYGDPWLDEVEEEEHGEQLFRLRTGIRDVVQQIEHTANQLLPTFLREHEGCVTIEVQHPTQWAHGRIELRYEQDFGSFRIPDLSAGMQRWVAAAVREACRRLSTLRRTQLTILDRGEIYEFDPAMDERTEAERVLELTDGELLAIDEVEFEIPLASAVLVVDEPELHLHPVAQQDVATWLLDRSREGLQVLIATHSPEFLSLELEDVEYVQVQSTPEGTTASPVGHRLLELLQESAARAGMHPVHALQAAKRILIVEGLHDELVLRAFYSHELSSGRVLLLRMEGLSNAFALAEADYLTLTALPIRVLADNSTAASIGKNSSWEEETLYRLQQLVADRELDLETVGYEDPDIICALPKELVERAWVTAEFEGWDPIVEEWRRLNIPNFKGFALNQMGLPDVGPTEFIERALARREPGDLPRANLQRAVKEALAS